jgi:hypothetical protein
LKSKPAKIEKKVKKPSAAATAQKKDDIYVTKGMTDYVKLMTSRKIQSA